MPARPTRRSPGLRLWDDGADPTAELTRLMTVRRAAIDRFGLDMLAPGEPVANLRRRFVPIWLLHRYEVVAAAKADRRRGLRLCGQWRRPRGVAAGFADRAARGAGCAAGHAGAGRSCACRPGCCRCCRRRATAATTASIDIEVFGTAGGPVFDPLVAADVAAEITLHALLAPTRLARLELQHAADPAAPGVGEVIDKLIAAALPDAADALSQRIAYRTIVTMAQTARDPATTPEVAALLDGKVHDDCAGTGASHA